MNGSGFQGRWKIRHQIVLEDCSEITTLSHDVFLAIKMVNLARIAILFFIFGVIEQLITSHACSTEKLKHINSYSQMSQQQILLHVLSTKSRSINILTTRNSRMYQSLWTCFCSPECHCISLPHSRKQCIQHDFILTPSQITKHKSFTISTKP